MEADHSKPMKRHRHSRSHSRDIHTNKGHYRPRTQSRLKARGSRSVLTSPHNASSHKGDMSSTTECLKYHSRSSSRYRKRTSKRSPSHSGTNQRKDRSRSPSQTRSKRHESQSLSCSKERKRQRQRRSDSRDIHTKSITDCEHDHIQKPEIHSYMYSGSNSSDIVQTKHHQPKHHHPDRQYVHGRKTVTNIEKLPQRNHVRHHNPDRHPVHGENSQT